MKSGTKLSLIPITTVYLFLLAVKHIYALDLINDFNNLFCNPVSGAGDLQISNSANPNPVVPIVLSTNKVLMGAINSIKAGGIELVMAGDDGQEVQYAFQVDGQGEANNPTEAAINGKFFSGCKSSDQLYTFNQMGYWRLYNGIGLSPFKLEKIVKIGAFGMPNVINFKAKIHMDLATTSTHFEIPTGYHIPRFHTQAVKIYDIDKDQIRDMTAAETLQNLWGIFAFAYMGKNIPVMWTGYMYLAAYSPSIYTNFWASDNYSLIKWSLFKQMGPIESGQKMYTDSYLIINTSYDAVVADLRRIISNATTSPQVYTATSNIWGQMDHGSPTRSSDIAFDGVDDFFELTNYPFDALKTISVEVVFKPDLSSGNTQVLYNKNGTITARIYNSGGGHCAIATQNNQWYATGSVTEWLTSKIKPNQWNHLICTYNGNKFFAYLNNELVSETLSTTGNVLNPHPTVNVNVGGQIEANTPFYKGQIKSVAFWRAPLSTQEVSARYNSFGNIFGQKPGDLNNDGAVNYQDFSIFKSDFGKSGSSGFIPADINIDGTVNIFDYNILVLNYAK